MRSNIFKIQKGAKYLPAILKESEKVAVYNELNHKQTMHLRLLCEDLDGMLPEIISEYTGKFWISFEKGLCKINVSIDVDDFNLKNKDQLLSVAKNKKNAAAVGVVNKIRSALEGLFLGADASDMYGVPMNGYGTEAVPVQYVDGSAYSQLWSLNNYKDAAEKKEWDELEKSVIASIADDIIVGIKGKHADIIIVKKFY